MAEFGGKKQAGWGGTIRYALVWDDPNMPQHERQAAEANLVAALEQVNAAFGGRQFDVASIKTDPAGARTDVTIKTDGCIDAELFGAALRNALEERSGDGE